jgi:hypothetical protein
MIANFISGLTRRAMETEQSSCRAITKPLPITDAAVGLWENLKEAAEQVRLHKQGNWNWMSIQLMLLFLFKKYIFILVKL